MFILGKSNSSSIEWSKIIDKGWAIRWVTPNTHNRNLLQLRPFIISKAPCGWTFQGTFLEWLLKFLITLLMFLTARNSSITYFSSLTMKNVVPLSGYIFKIVLPDTNLLLTSWPESKPLKAVHTLCNVKLSLCSVLCILFSMQCAVFSWQSAAFSVHCAVFVVRCALSTVEWEHKSVGNIAQTELSKENEWFQLKCPRLSQIPVIRICFRFPYHDNLVNMVTYLTVPEHKAKFRNKSPLPIWKMWHWNLERMLKRGGSTERRLEIKEFRAKFLLLYWIHDYLPF